MSIEPEALAEPRRRKRPWSCRQRHRGLTSRRRLSGGYLLAGNFDTNPDQVRSPSDQHDRRDTKQLEVQISPHRSTTRIEVQKLRQSHIGHRNLLDDLFCSCAFRELESGCTRFRRSHLSCGFPNCLKPFWP